jgi:hypothetical protein
LEGLLVPPRYAGGVSPEFDFANKPDLIKSLWLSTKNIWPDRDKLPANVDLKVILQNGMNSGLKIRALHQKGYTGQGVNLAIHVRPFREQR